MSPRDDYPPADDAATSAATPLSESAAAGDSAVEPPDEAVVEFSIEREDMPELERLIQIYGAGDRDVFLREVIRVMAARELAAAHRTSTGVGLPTPPERE